MNLETIILTCLIILIALTLILRPLAIDFEKEHNKHISPKLDEGFRFLNSTEYKIIYNQELNIICFNVTQ